MLKMDAGLLRDFAERYTAAELRRWGGSRSARLRKAS